MPAILPQPPPPPSAPADTWTNVTHNVGGDKWGYAGITALVTVPDSDRIIAGVSEQGLWITTDRGETWTKLAAADKVQITNRPYQIVFDPKNPQHFWESGNYGPGLFFTADAGKFFPALAMSPISMASASISPTPFAGPSSSAITNAPAASKNPPTAARPGRRSA